MFQAGYKRWSFKPLVLSCGMRRSGSTLLYNSLREILKHKWGNRVTCGWVTDFKRKPFSRVYLIKTHDVPDYRLWRPRHIFYTFRDVRVAAVSDYRRFGREITRDSIREAVDTYRKAQQHADMLLKYEDFAADTVAAIAKMAEHLEIDIDPNRVNDAVKALKPPEAGQWHDGLTLLHPGHMTGTQDDDWDSVIPGDLADWINTEFRWWFAECGYRAD